MDLFANVNIVLVVPNAALHKSLCIDVSMTRIQGTFHVTTDIENALHVNRFTYACKRSRYSICRCPVRYRQVLK